MSPAASRPDLKVAKIMGMDDDARAALTRMATLAMGQKIAVAGRFMPDRGVSAKLAEMGITELVEEEDFFRYARIVVPYSGIRSRQRKEWEAAGHRLEDLTSPRVRRAQVSLGLLAMEGAQTLVLGRHGEAETLALASNHSGTKIIEDTTDTARLLFAPSFGVVSHTNLSPRKANWLVQQLRHRYHDARVTFLDTISPAMAAREEALERLLVDCKLAVIVGDPGEASCEALAEAALRRGIPAVVVASPDEIDPAILTTKQNVALTAGAFATNEAIRAVATALAFK